MFYKKNDPQNLVTIFYYGIDTRGDHWAKIVGQCAIKIGSNIFIVGKFCKKITCKIGDFKIVKHVYM
jgi:hypothetical protein